MNIIQNISNKIQEDQMKIKLDNFFLNDFSIAINKILLSITDKERNIIESDCMF